MARFASTDAPHEPEQVAPQRPAPQSPSFSRGVPSFSRGSGSNRKPNAYAGRCRNCDGWVEAQEGYLAGSRTEGWAVEHISCPPVGARPSARPSNSQSAPPSAPFAVPDGTYTIVWGDHYKTIRVRKQDEFDDFMPGRTILAFLSGSDNTSDYTSFGHVDERGDLRIWRKHQDNETLREAVKVLLGDPKACAIAYARETNHCWRCQRLLTTPESIERGLGPECAAKAGW